MKDALREVWTNGMSSQKASKTYNIPLEMLQNKIIGTYSRSVGWQIQLFEECSVKIAKQLNVWTYKQIEKKLSLAQRSVSY